MRAETGQSTELTDEERLRSENAWMLVVDQPLSVKGAARGRVPLEDTEESTDA